MEWTLIMRPYFKRLIFFAAIFYLLFPFVNPIIFATNAQGHNMQAMMQSIREKPTLEQPQLIFEQFCANCHGKEPSIDVGAPIIGEKKGWAAWFKLSQSDLLKQVMNSTGIMPPRGGCSECTAKELGAVIHFIKSSIQE
ncbi:MAG: hypothetical protein A3F17_02860 [Gammaproteobacteria bacterium RIFCSPHIGHO2_12_FULL_41_15]|nr:MAG: hypothetical protein A3F17_02860 [Gammaproteobacteria bacterium RIFCSPHIGHO2_12_FULL_41_15]